MKRLLSFLCVMLVCGAALPAARACKYCQMAAAADPEGNRLSNQVQTQDFPLEGVINQYAPTAPTANLAAAPAAGSVATNAADLPAAVRRRGAPVPPAVAQKVLPAPVAKSVPAPVGVAAVGSSHWADAGLLGLLAAGGMFCWRTRRATSPQP